MKLQAIKTQGEHMEKSITIDCTNLPCPQPVIQTKNTLEEMSGDELTVIVDNEAAVNNVSRFAESRGHTIELRARGAQYFLFIKKGKSEQKKAAPQVKCETPAATKNMVIYISAEVMGRGSDKLGALLMTAYFESLTHLAGEISHIILVNSGVKLAVKKTETLHHLQELEKTGIEILVCGTCLDFYDIRKQLGAGTISNMYAILETMSRADKVINP